MSKLSIYLTFVSWPSCPKRTLWIPWPSLPKTRPCDSWPWPSWPNKPLPLDSCTAYKNTSSALVIMVLHLFLFCRQSDNAVLKYASEDFSLLTKCYPVSVYYLLDELVGIKWPRELIYLLLHMCRRMIHAKNETGNTAAQSADCFLIWVMEEKRGKYRKLQVITVACF